VRVLLLLAAAYAIGSIPTSYLFGRRAGTDLRTVGSGNLGATNVMRVLGARSAVPVAVIDIAKGFLPAWFFPLWDGSGYASLSAVYGACAVVGHIWSAFLRFRGGKGVATAGGATLAVAPLAAITGTLAWVGILLITRVASLASLVAASIIPLVAYVSDATPEVVTFCTGVAILVWWTHRSNILRLRHGEEHRFRRADSKTSDGEET
jgi:glycerol-3-phosphate acyltransferase PlsY